MAGPNIDALLGSNEERYRKLQERVKETLKREDPEEYRRRFGEDASAGQSVQMPPATKILLPPDMLPKIERIEWDTYVTRNEGFTVARVLMLTFVFLIAIPVAMALMVTEAMFPGALVLVGAFALVYLAGKAQGSVSKRKVGE